MEIYLHINTKGNVDTVFPEPHKHQDRAGTHYAIKAWDAQESPPSGTNVIPSIAS